MLIALGYQARVGKDTAADFLVEHFGFVKLSFAEPLKEAIRITHGYSDEQLYGSLKETTDSFWGETPRQTLQKFGTDALRMHYRDDIWIMSTQRKIIKHLEHGTPVVISDCRFINEAQAIKNMAGHLIKINASFAGRQFTQSSEHISEIEMSTFNGWDLTIDNDDTIEKYFSKVKGAYSALQKGEVHGNKR